MNPNLNFWLYPEVYIYIYTYIQNQKPIVFKKKKLRMNPKLNFWLPPEICIKNFTKFFFSPYKQFNKQYGSGVWTSSIFFINFILEMDL